MTSIALPGCPDIASAFAWLAREAAGRVVLRFVIFRGPDGLLRGSAMVLERARGTT